MASIRRIENKTGIAYRITVSSGRDITGKQLRHYKTYVPPATWSKTRQDKEALKVANDFEREITEGYRLDNRQSFAEYAEYVLATKKRAGIKTTTLDRYRSLLNRINKTIGHIKIADIRPQHLNTLYAALSAEGIRETGKKAIAKTNLIALIKDRSMLLNAFGASVGIASSTISAASRGKRISYKTAETIARGLDKKVDALFTIEEDSTPLAGKTVLEHHRLINTILSQAEKELLVPYNAAAKAVPPKAKRKRVNFFDIDELNEILTALESEPLKWRLATHLLLVTGCRRGEIMGLKWDKIDFDKRTVTISEALLYSTTRGVYSDTTKTGDIRVLALVDETIDLLLCWKETQDYERKINGDRWQETGYIFTRDDGRPMSPDSITSWLSGFSKRHGLKHINPHAFRHSAASLMIHNGLDVLTVSGQLGHATPSTTTNIYGHMYESASRVASESIANTILRGNRRPHKTGETE